MSMEQFITRITDQTAVYWGSPESDGLGGMIFDSPIEIAVRWADVNELITAADGTQYVCRAKIMVNVDLDVDGYLYLGTLDELESDEYNYPKDIDKAYRIRKVDKVVAMGDLIEYVRMVYL